MYVTSLPPDLVCIGQILLPLHLTRFGLEQPAAQVPGCFLTKLDIVRGKKKEEEKKKKKKKDEGKEEKEQKERRTITFIPGRFF